MQAKCLHSLQASNQRHSPQIMDFLARSKELATLAIEQDVGGSPAEALQLYHSTCALLRQGMQLETDPDAIVAIRGKLSSFERRIDELNGREQEHEQDQGDLADLSLSLGHISAELTDADSGSDSGINIGTDDDSGSDGEDEEGATADDASDEGELGGTAARRGPGPGWCDMEPEVHVNSNARSSRNNHAEQPSAQLRSSQEEMRGLMHSRDELETQISDARARADAYTKNLEVARVRSEMDGQLSLSHGLALRAASVSPGARAMGGTEEKEEDSSVVSVSSNNTNVAVVHDDNGSTSRRRSPRDATGLTDRVAALERLVKAQQREIIVANTDLRVSRARSAALQQKLEEQMSPAEHSDSTRQLTLAETFADGVKERMREAETSKAEVLALNRVLVERIGASQKECSQLKESAQQLRTAMASVPVAPSTHAHAHAHAGTSTVDMGGLPLPPPSHTEEVEGHSSSASTISTVTEVAFAEAAPAPDLPPPLAAATSIMKQWRQQAQENINSRVGVGAAAGDEMSQPQSPSDIASFEETQGLLREGYSLAASVGQSARDILMGTSVGQGSRTTTTASSSSAGTGGSGSGLGGRSSSASAAGKLAKTTAKGHAEGAGAAAATSTSTTSSSRKQQQQALLTLTKSASSSSSRHAAAAKRREEASQRRHEEVATKIATPVRRPATAPQASSCRSSSSNNNSSGRRQQLKVVVPSGRQTQNAGTATPMRRGTGLHSSSRITHTPMRSSLDRANPTTTITTTTTATAASSSSLGRGDAHMRVLLSAPKARASAAALALNPSRNSIRRTGSSGLGSKSTPTLTSRRK